VPLPPNVSAELQRDMARLGFVMGQIIRCTKSAARIQKRWGRRSVTTTA
jgi:hypothetical protein